MSPNQIEFPENFISPETNPEVIQTPQPVEVFKGAETGPEVNPAPQTGDSLAMGGSALDAASIDTLEAPETPESIPLTGEKAAYVAFVLTARLVALRNQAKNEAKR